MLSNLYKFFILKLLFLFMFAVNFIPAKVYCNQQIALLGDSLMSGYGLDVEFHLSTVLEKNLKLKGFDVKVINASVSGDTTSGGLNRLNWLLTGKDIDIVILCLGANDMLRGINPIQIRKNLDKILENLVERKITVLFAGMLAQESFGEKYKKEFDKIFPELAKNLRFLFYLFY